MTITGNASMEAFGYDLTGFTHVLLDVYISSPSGGPAQGPALSLYDSGSFEVDAYPDAGTTGAFTLDVDISAAPDKTDLAIDINGNGSSVGYICNLRAY
jgi:hypothetical protein